MLRAFLFPPLKREGRRGDARRAERGGEGSLRRKQDPHPDASRPPSPFQGEENFLRTLTLSCALVAALTLPARAATVADFYRGKTVQVIVGFSPGGGYDLYARVLARYIGRHIPGQPTVVTQNMPGAGSVKAANYLYAVAPKDGTVFGIFDRGLPMEKLLGRSTGIEIGRAHV